jgi:glycosyltransferase involved in cell wall biosynthesis
MIVAFQGHTDVPVARLICNLKQVPLIFDVFISLYDVDVFDRQVVRPRSLTAKKRYWIDKVACWLADVVLLDTQSHIRYFVETFRLRENKFRRLWIGADDEIMRLSSSVQESCPFSVVFSGTFIPIHGIEYIIHAARILEQRRETIRFNIIGSGQTFQKITRMVSELNIHNVEFKGRVPYEDLIGLMSQAHLCLGNFGTSGKGKRVIPNKVFEALALKRAVITGDAPAIREAFTHGENIWLCPMGDAEALADAISELKRRSDVRENIAHNGYELFVREFSLEATKKRIVSIIVEVQRNGARDTGRRSA